MIRTSTDSRTRAQRYADSQWWMPGVKIVGYAIHLPEFDLPRSKVYLVEILQTDGTKTMRWVCVSTDTVSDFIYECWEPRMERKTPIGHPNFAEVTV